MELSAEAMVRELQAQIIILSSRAAEYAAMVDSLQKRLAEATKESEQKLKAVE